MIEKLLQIAVDAPLSSPLTYLPLDGEGAVPARGTSVRVPLGARKAHGVVLGEATISPEFKLKPFTEIMSERPCLPEVHLKWLEWMSQYYQYPIGQVVALAFPPLLKKDRRGQSKKAPLIKQISAENPPELTLEQKNCVATLEKRSDFAVNLLHGVTGSGKTEVYLQAFAKTLQAGKQGLFLVPEISLTPQLVHRFVSRFGDRVAILHSHLTEREKTEQWWSIVEGKKDILLGARSALFCPIERLGLIILDEEHEPSFKQDEKLKYHARDAAIMLAKLTNCPIILGSATPSLESWQRVQEGQYQLLEMRQRVAERAMPEIEVIDLREERRHRRDKPSPLPFWLSERLYEAIDVTLKRHEQVALFLNRRGLAQSVLCGECGHSFTCPNCAISLTLHRRDHLLCHYCDYSERMPEHCPKCSASAVESLGLGTELIANELEKLFPTARIARADRDEIQSREDMEQFISSVENRSVDILVGTQMIAKGLDFPGLTLVGLVLADVGFSIPDFRANERSYQLLAQMSGRSGRHSELPGRVIIQTYNPDHPAVTYAQSNNYHDFVTSELVLRRELFYPPFSRLALLRLKGQSLDKVTQAANALAQRSRRLVNTNNSYSEIKILGPAPSPIAKLRNQFRFQLLVKGPDSRTNLKYCHQLVGNSDWLPKGVRLSVDIDPINMI